MSVDLRADWRPREVLQRRGAPDRSHKGLRASGRRSGRGCGGRADS